MVEEKAGRTTNKQNNVINPPVSISAVPTPIQETLRFSTVSP